MLDKSEKLKRASAQRANLKSRKEKERHEAFEKQCQENEAKGLTSLGYTKSFEGQWRIFYLNNVEIKCTVDYKQSTPHLEFSGEPNVMTDTGYRSHFLHMDLNRYSTMKEMIEDVVAAIMNEERKRSKKYTLTWTPNLDYLKHSPKQLTLFDLSEVARWQC